MRVFTIGSEDILSSIELVVATACSIETLNSGDGSGATFEITTSPLLVL